MLRLRWGKLIKLASCVLLSWYAIEGMWSLRVYVYLAKDVDGLVVELARYVDFMYLWTNDGLSEAYDANCDGWYIITRYVFYLLSVIAYRIVVHVL